MDENLNKNEVVDYENQILKNETTNNTYQETDAGESNTSHEEVKEGEVIGDDGFSLQDKEDNRAMAILCYIGILSLIPYAAEKKSKWVRYNAVQGVNILILQLIGSILAIIPFVGGLATTVISIYTFIISIMGIVNVCNGKAEELPAMNNFRFVKE